MLCLRSVSPTPPNEERFVSGPVCSGESEESAPHDDIPGEGFSRQDALKKTCHLQRIGHSSRQDEQPQREPAGEEERGYQRGKDDQEAKPMQYPMKGGDRTFCKEAIVHQPCPGQHKEKGAGPQSLSVEHLPHLLKKADREGNEQQTEDDKIG